MVLEQAVVSFPLTGRWTPTPFYLVVIWKHAHAETLFMSRFPGRPFGKFNMRDLDMIHKIIPPGHYQPSLNPSMTVAKFEKTITKARLQYYTSRLIGYDGTDAIAHRLHAEILVLEKIRQKPHPNLMQYYGCSVSRDTGLVEGMWVSNVAWTLYDLFQGNDGRR